MNDMQLQPVPLRFQLSYLMLFSVSLPLQVRVERLIDQTSPVERLDPPTEDLVQGSQGFMIRGLPVANELPSICWTDKYIIYALFQYTHYYIDLSGSFEDYEGKFSSKTRSTIKRKIRKYSDHFEGTIPWKTYTKSYELQEFFKYARDVSKKTYQEKLLGAGIPTSENFIRKAESLAAENRLRAYILFDGERPVAYLYLPVRDGVLIYAYLGYDPDYSRMSVGTVLQWLSLQELFREECFRYFDFTEGESEHKRLFSTNQRQSAHVIFLEKNLKNAALIYSHFYMNRLSNLLGETLERLGLKSKIKRWLRHTR